MIYLLDVRDVRKEEKKLSSYALNWYFQTNDFSFKSDWMRTNEPASKQNKFNATACNGLQHIFILPVTIWFFFNKSHSTETRKMRKCEEKIVMLCVYSHAIS